MLQGIDVSKHNGLINWKKVRDEGKITHTIIRAGYGKNNIDEQFTRNAEAAVNLGFTSGIYWFSYALNSKMSEDEAKYAIAAASKYWKSCPIAYDAEYDTRIRAAKNGVNLEKKELTAMAYTFLARVLSEGFLPVLYTNNDYTKNFFDIPYLKSQIPGLYIWYARYGAEDSNIKGLPADMWQFSSKGRVPGINTNVDMNYIYKNWTTTLFLEEKIVNTIRPTGTSATSGLNHHIKWFQQSYSADIAEGNLQVKGDMPSILKDDGIDDAETERARKSIYIRKGCKYPNLVKFIQGELHMRGLYFGEINGNFDHETRVSLQKFQLQQGLEPDGIAGNKTITAMFY